MESHYILGEQKVALELARRTGDVGTKLLQGAPCVSRAHFYRGLVFLGEACEGRGIRANLLAAKKGMTLMQKWIDGGDVNCRHMLRLLEAEQARATGKTEAAKDLYTEAIKIACNTGHIQDAGVCHERAAVFHLQFSDKARAAHHIEQAAKAFREWGASAKVQQLLEKYTNLLETHGSSMMSAVFQVDSGS